MSVKQTRSLFCSGKSFHFSLPGLCLLVHPEMQSFRLNASLAGFDKGNTESTFGSEHMLVWLCFGVACGLFNVLRKTHFSIYTIVFGFNFAVQYCTIYKSFVRLVSRNHEEQQETLTAIGHSRVANPPSPNKMYHKWQYYSEPGGRL